MKLLKDTMKIGLTIPNTGPLSTPPQTEVTSYSQDSGPAPFDTIFDAFDLVASPVYNFWTQDEETNESEERGSRDLSDVPRYIRITWNIAPDLSPMFNQATSFSARGKNLRERSGAGSSTGVKINGIDFKPPQLQSDDIEFASNSLANGFVAPGVIETVVEIDEQSFSSNISMNPNLVDEDEYLSERSNWGIPYNEFNSMMWARKSSVLAA